MTRAEAARHASLVRWKKESPLGTPDPAAIQARVKEILAANAAKKLKKGKPKAGGKGKAPKKVDPAKAKAKADREKAQAAKKQERDQAKQERVSAQVAKQKQAEDRKQRILAEKVKRGDKLSAADTVDAQDAGLMKDGAKPKPAKQAAGGSKKPSAKEPKQASAPKPDKAKETASNRAKVAQAMADQDAGLSPGGSAALTKFADGGSLDDSTAKQLGDMGLVETGADGSHRLSSEGRAAAAAMDKGDVRGTLDAISRAADKKKAGADKAKAKSDADTARSTAQAGREKARADATAKRTARADAVEAARIQAAQTRHTRKAIKMSDLAIKAGARHSRNDMEHLQAIHDSAVACGASCDPGDDEETDDSAELLDDDAAKAIKGVMDDPGYYAQHECGDVMQAASALQTLCMLIQSELAEDDEDQTDIAQLCDAARTLVDFIGSEIDELEGAAKEGAGSMKAVIGKRDDVNPKAGVAEYGKVAFADEKNKKYPVDTEEHIRAAYSYINHPDAAAKYSADEVKTIKAKIVAAWKKTIDPAGPPSAGKAVDDTWLHIDGGAVKATDDDTIRGLAILYGTKSTHDLERDYLDKDTDLWLNHWGWPRPITYHHGMDKDTRDDPIVGHWTKAVATDEGVWLEGQLDRAHRYYKAVKELARRGYLKISSDSGPQWVIREPQTNGANYIKRWPLVTASVTVTPMEPRMMPVEVKALLAEIGVDAIDEDTEAINPESARSDATKADEERARAILLELELLELEAA